MKLLSITSLIFRDPAQIIRKKSFYFNVSYNNLINLNHVQKNNNCKMQKKSLQSQCQRLQKNSLPPNKGFAKNTKF